MRRTTCFLMTVALAASAASARGAEIHDAVRGEDLARVQALLEKDPGLVNARTQDGSTPLFDAVRKKNLAIAELLVSKGADVNARDQRGMTVLHTACRNGSPVELVRLLVEKGASVNAVAKYQGKPLDLAWESHAEDVVRFLESKGAEFTPLRLDTSRLSDRLTRIEFAWGLRNNVVVSTGRDGALIVDTGFSTRSLDEIRKIIGKLGKSGIRYVVNTHPNWDHVAGNGLAPSEEAVIGYRKLDSLARAGVLSTSDKPLTGRTGKSLPAPYVMKFNGEEIALIPYPGLHTDEDILIHFRGSNVVCMGDLLLSQSCPATGNVSGYMEMLDDVLDVFPDGTTFVSGHGKDLSRDGLKKYHDDLVRMTDIVKANRAAGKTAEDMIRADLLGKYKADYTQLDWLGPDRWISTVVENLNSGRLH